MKSEQDGINLSAKPSGTGCVECLATDGWWLHLRRCAECGHIGCCDSSPSQHASKHNAATGHRSSTASSPATNGSTITEREKLLRVPSCTTLARIRRTNLCQD